MLIGQEWVRPFLRDCQKKSVILLPGVFFQAQCQQHCHYCLEISCLTCKNQGLRCQFIILGFPQLAGAHFPFAGEMFGQISSIFLLNLKGQAL